MAPVSGMRNDAPSPLNDPSPPQADEGLGFEAAWDLHEELTQLWAEVEHLRAQLREDRRQLARSEQEAVLLDQELQANTEELTTAVAELRAANATLRFEVRARQALGEDLLNLLRCTEVAALFLDPERRIRRFTPGAREFVSVRATDLGRPLADLRRRYDDPAFERDLAAVLAGEELRDAEVEADGRWCRRRILPFRAATGECAGAIVYFVDTHDEHRRREELEERVAERTAELEREVGVRRAAEDSLRSIFETANDAIVVADAAWVIRRCNPATARLFGHPCEELVGTPLRRLLSGDADLAAAAPALAPGEAREVVGVHRDGQLLPLELTLGHLQASQQGELHVGILRDLRARKTLEAELVRAQKLEALGRLSGGMAHEFKNLLMGIGGAARALTEGLPTGGAERTHAGELVHAIERGVDLTRRLLSLSGPEPTVSAQDSTPLDRTLSDVAPLLGHVLRERGSAGEAPRLELALAAPAAVRVPAATLERVLVNLLLNARDASLPGGRIEVRTELTALPAAAAEERGVPAGDYAVLSVRDEGCGMPPEVRERAFEPFFTTKAPGLGTGLGLALVRRLVLDAGGFVELESALGQGTTVRVHLPLAPADAAPPAPPSAEPGPAVGRLLVVEDDALVRLGLCQQLQRAGYEVLESASLEEGAATWRQHAAAIDLVISDLSLAGRSGSELLGPLRPPHARASVLFASALSPEEAARETGLPAGEVLEKPFTGRELLQRVRERLRPALA